MITKFERKVIAGLTAFLMCLSMIFAVPVSVNAEAERTQDEAVSGVQQNETVKDVQIPDGMSENVPHDIIAGDEAGDVPHDITVGDEASEKVQQDTVEAGGAAKEKEDQPTAPYENTSDAECRSAGRSGRNNHSEKRRNTGIWRSCFFDRTDNGSLSFEYRGRRAVLLWFN